MSIITVIIIIVAVVIILALLALMQYHRLKEKAKECAKEAQVFHDKLQKLIDPSHLFTDEELRQIKREYAPLLDDVNDLYDSMFISDDYLDGLRLRDFLRERKFLNHMQSQNNQLHK